MNCNCGSGTTPAPVVVHVMGLQGPRGFQGEKGEPGPKGEKGDPGIVEGVVKFTDVQDLSATERAIARLNISAASLKDIEVPDLKEIYLNAKNSEGD